MIEQGFMVDFSMVLISLLLIVLSYIIFSVGIWFTKNKLKNPKYSITIPAQIVGIKEERDDGSHSFHPIVSYSLNGQDYQFVLRDTLNSTILFSPRGQNLSHNVGDVITLKMNPLNMNDCYCPEIKMATLKSLCQLRKVVMGIICVFSIIFVLF